MAGLSLPKRTSQKKSEADSLAILQLKLGGIGILRGQTDSDYGIDADLEMVQRGAVTGRSVKLQVKSSVDLKLRKDGTPKVGGIKQSTLNYWCRIAFQTNVVAYAVDLATQKIYITDDLFWQATRLIDGGQSTKSIAFLREGEDAVAVVLTLAQAWQPTMTELVAAHALALRRLKSFLKLLADAFQFDAGSELHYPDDFRDLLQACKVLLWNKGQTLWSDEADRRGWQSYEYWKAKCDEDGWDGVCYYPAQPILTTLVPALIRRLRLLKRRVIRGQYFWAHQDPSYLALVYDTTIPDVTGKDKLIEWAYEYDKRSTVGRGMGAYYAQQALTPPAKKATKKNGPGR